MTELVLLREDHAEAVLAFEMVNRGYFASIITDRGDAYFEDFSERHQALLAEQAAGTGAFHLLLDADGSVLGRFNLLFGEPATAEVGYRVAEAVTGRGVATAGVGALCRLAAIRYRLTGLRAATAEANVASQRVLTKNGFVLVGPADPAQVGGRAGFWWARDLHPGAEHAAGDAQGVLPET